MRGFRLPLVLFGGLFSPCAVFAQYNPGFVAARAVPVGGTPWAFATADLNHDGVQDVVVADGSTTTFDAGGVSHTTIYGIAVLIGKGGGAFKPAVHYATSDSASFVALADLNGDGYTDVVTASDDPLLDTPGGSVQVLKNNGDGTFGAAAKYSFPGWIATSVLPGDVNGDGHVDLTVALVSATDQNTHATQYLINNGDGTFRVSTTQVAGVIPVAVADFYNEGRMSVATISGGVSAQASIGVTRGTGGGAAAMRGQTAIPPITADSFWTVGDFNGDGYPDLLLASRKSSAATLLLNNHDGSFTASGFPISFTPSGAASGDFNKDGIADVALIDNQARLFVQFGRADGTFTYPVQYDTAGTGVLGEFALQAVDLNNDGVLDLATTTPTGSFVPIFGKPGGTFNSGSEITLAPGLDALSIATADFNHDGIPDLAELNFLASQGSIQQIVGIYLGDGTGRFKMTAAKPDPGFAASAIAAKDINHDGIPDLVFLNAVGASNNSELAVMLGKGDGTFGAPQYFGSIPPFGSNTPQESSPIYLSDVNNDGNLDAVTFAGVHLGRGDGTFGPAIPLPVGNYLFALGDFNEDGKLDLVTLSDDESDFRSPALTIWQGDGAGRFPVSNFSMAMPFGDLQHNMLNVGHFTRDGHLGVIAGAVGQFYPDPDFRTVSNGAFSLLAGKGDGTLKAPVIYQLQYGLWGLVTGDFNDDGVDDVVGFNGGFYPNQGPGYVTYSEYQLSLFTNRGDGTLLPPVNMGAGDDWFNANSTPMVVADFNHDGALDIAGSTGGAINVLMNSRGTSVSLTATPALPKVGTPVTLKCTITASFRFSGSLSGRVTFYDGSTALGTVDQAYGSASLTTSALSRGTHSISAVFLGNGNYNAHPTSPVTITVTP